MPASLTDFMEIWKIVIIDKKGKASIDDFNKSWQIPLNSSAIQFTPFPNTAIYSPIPHIPQAIGIFIGRMLNLPVIAVFYLGRLFNLLICTVLLFFAIKNIPVYKWLLVLLVLMPMTIYLLASMSGDAITISLAFLYISLIFKLTFDKKSNISKHEYFALLLIGIMLTLAKNAYFPITMLCLIIPVKNFGLLKNYIVKNSTLLLSVGVVVIINGLISQHFFNKIDLEEIYRTYPTMPHFNPDKQLNFVLSNPLFFLSMLIHSYWFFKLYLIESLVGAFGWDFYRLPLIHIYMYVATLFAFAVLESKKEIKIGWRQKTLLLVSLIGCIVVFSLMMYMIWADVGANQLTNLQGRYFIPMIPLFWFLLYNRKVFVKNSILRTSTVVVLFFSMISTVVTLIERYYHP